MSYVEEALKRTGWGLYSKFLVGFTSICAFFNGMSFIIMPLYLPILRCDLPLSDSMVNSINICLPIGFSLGGFIFSAIGDVVGRKSAMSSSLLITFTGILAACFAYNGGSIIVSSLILGTGLATNMIITKIHLAETFPIKYRGRCIILQDIMWIIGTISGVLLFMIFMPILLNNKTNNIRIFSWRFVYGFSGIFMISLACTTALILPSPRYLLYEKRSAEALHVLRQIFAINSSKMSENELHGKIADFGINVERDIPNNMSTRRCGIILRRVHKGIVTLLRKEFVCKIFLFIILRLTTCIGMFLLTMLLAKTMYFQNNCRLNRLNLQNFESHNVTKCNNSDFEIDVYRDYSILSLFLIFGQVVASVIVNNVEKKYFIGLTLFISGSLLILLSFIKYSYALRFLISSAILFTFAISESFLNVSVIEIFPTAVRGTAFGETLMLPGIVVMLLQKFLPIPCYTTFLGVGSLFEVGALCSFLIPKFKNKPMVD